jgi:S-methyl-5-thioribose-1-phosphate isomerase
LNFYFHKPEDFSYSRAIWSKGKEVVMIDQTKLPFEEVLFIAQDYRACCYAIKEMIVRGAGSIGAAAGFALMLASQEAQKGNDPSFLEKAKTEIEATRPTARDLFYATERVYEKAKISSYAAETEASLIADEISEAGRLIGIFGNRLIKNGHKILTHCNAGPLALVEYGSALAPIIEAHRQGKEIFVYVDETRPRNQGAKLTAWELNRAGVPHTIIADNVAGLLMQRQQIDMVITGADRIAKNGDTANKIGTLEKAILAKEFGIPFYVAAPESTFDRNIASGSEIRIEERDELEVLNITGRDETGKIQTISIASPGSSAYNPAFDVTPAKYIHSFITSRGIISSEMI